MSRRVRVSQIATVDLSPANTAAAYSADDAVGASQSTEVHEIAGQAIYIVSALFIDSDNQAPDLDIHIFNENFTAQDDNDAFTIADADAPKYQGIVDVAAAQYLQATTSLDYSFQADALYVPLVNKNIYWQCQLKTAGETFTAADSLTVRLTYLKLFSF